MLRGKSFEISLGAVDIDGFDGDGRGVAESCVCDFVDDGVEAAVDLMKEGLAVWGD